MNSKLYGLCSSWLVHGKPRHPQSQGTVERANGDIKDMLIAWMGVNSTSDWSTGIKLVQLQKNSSFQSRIKRAPYAAMFGCDVKVGLTSSSLPTEIIERMQSEDNLLSAIATPETQQQSTSTPIPEPNLTSTSQSNLHSNPSPNSTMSTNDLSIAGVNENISAIDTIMPVLTAVPTFVTNNVSQSDDPPPMSHALIDNITSRMDSILMERQGARSAQFAQAERMVKRRRVDLAHGHPGDNVAVPIPLVDRGRGGPRNILGVIIDRNENNMYTICVKSGILKPKYSRNQFDLCPQRLLQESDVDQTKTTTLRQAVTQESTSGGQGYVKCNCAGSKRCESNRCKCFKNKVKCSSRCHSSLACKHK